MIFAECGQSECIQERATRRTASCYNQTSKSCTLSEKSLWFGKPLAESGEKKPFTCLYGQQIFFLTYVGMYRLRRTFVWADEKRLLAVWSTERFCKSYHIFLTKEKEIPPEHTWKSAQAIFHFRIHFSLFIIIIINNISVWFLSWFISASRCVLYSL